MPAKEDSRAISCIERALTVHTTEQPNPTHLRWRVVDIVVASVLGVASSLIFTAWNVLYAGPWKLFSVMLPGSEGLVNGVWLFAGVLGAIIVRKPGAALYAETLAAVVSGLIGNQWGGFETILIGLLQGLGAELVFAAFRYKVWNLPVTILAGAISGVFCAGYSLMGSYAGYAWGFKFAYLGATIISGAVIAGIGSWYLAKALAATGALNRFAIGKSAQPRV